MYRCKITVLKRLANQDVVAAHMGEEYNSRGLVPCPNFTEGQEFIAESPGVVPEEFCAWAWAGIHKEIVAIMNGGDFRPWVKQPGTAIACCTDGFRPVVFKIERIDNETN